jgi:hypothetical protein
VYEGLVVVVGTRLLDGVRGVWLSLGLVGDPGQAEGVNNKLEGINNRIARAKQPRHFNLYRSSPLSNPGRVTILNHYEALQHILLVALDMNLHTHVCTRK